MSVALMAIAAACCGSALRWLAGFVADRFGWSREEAQEAVASAGLSLLVTTRTDGEVAER